MAVPGAKALRYTLTNPDADAEVLSWIRRVSPSHFVVRHNPDADDTNPHWHAMLWSERSAQTLRVELLKVIPAAKRRYSLKDVAATAEDHEAYQRYMCHADGEGARVHIVSAQAPVHAPAATYTAAWAADQNKRYYQVQRAYTKKQKDDKRPMLERVLQATQDAGLNTPTEIAGLMVELYAREKKPMRKYDMQSILKTVWYTVNNKEAKCTLVRDLVSCVSEINMY